MVGRFADRSVAVVTRRAGVERVLILAVEVAGLARGLRMCAGEREFGSGVIERAFERLAETW